MKDPAYGHVLGSDAGIACVQLGGEIDLAAAGALGQVLSELKTVPRSAVYVDLADVTFADATLVNFICQIMAGLPAGTPVLLCRARDMTRALLYLCSLDATAAIMSNLPADFAGRPSAIAEGRVATSGELRPRGRDAVESPRL